MVVSLCCTGIANVIEGCGPARHTFPSGSLQLRFPFFLRSLQFERRSGLSIGHITGIKAYADLLIESPKGFAPFGFLPVQGSGADRLPVPFQGLLFVIVRQSQGKSMAREWFFMGLHGASTALRRDSSAVLDFRCPGRECGLDQMGWLTPAVSLHATRSTVARYRRACSHASGHSVAGLC